MFRSKPSENEIPEGEFTQADIGISLGTGECGYNNDFIKTNVQDR